MTYFIKSPNRDSSSCIKDRGMILHNETHQGNYHEEKEWPRSIFFHISLPAIPLKQETTISLIYHTTSYVMEGKIHILITD
jgi:hypothetical protein